MSGHSAKPVPQSQSTFKRHIFFAKNAFSRLHLFLVNIQTSHLPCSSKKQLANFPRNCAKARGIPRLEKTYGTLGELSSPAGSSASIHLRKAPSGTSTRTNQHFTMVVALGSAVGTPEPPVKPNQVVPSDLDIFKVCSLNLHLGLVVHLSPRLVNEPSLTGHHIQLKHPIEVGSSPWLTSNHEQVEIPHQQTPRSTIRKTRQKRTNKERSKPNRNKSTRSTGVPPLTRRVRGKLRSNERKHTTILCSKRASEVNEFDMLFM